MAEYFRRGVSEIHWLTSAPTLAAPTQAQITGGTDITGDIADISGWEFNNSPISTPSLDSTFTTTIVGEDTAGGPEIMCYDDDATTTVRDLFTKGNAGWMVLCPTGAGVGKPSHVFPVTSTGLNDQWTLGNEAAKYTASFAVTSVPSLDGTQT